MKLTSSLYIQIQSMAAEIKSQIIEEINKRQEESQSSSDQPACHVDLW